MLYTVYFVTVDHDSEKCSTTERTIVEATSAEDAVNKFYAGSDMAGCYIEEVIPLNW